MRHNTGSAPLIIAEIGGNHGGDLALAKRMVAAAVEGGAGAVKFQTYVAQEFVDPSHPSFEGFRREELGADDFRELFAYCRTLRVPFLATPFDHASADLLASLPVPMVKIASGDVTHLPLIDRVARMGVPVLLSIGACDWNEADAAVAAIRRRNDRPLTVLHCTAAYPCPEAEANLRLIPEIAARYGCRVGFSDHTVGVGVALGAIALGASVVEKHFTIDRALPGGDNEMSIVPDELKVLVREASRIRAALGTARKDVAPSEAPLRDFLRRSLVARRRLRTGERLRADDLCYRRPAGGLPPSAMERVLGRTCRSDIEAGELLRLEDLL